MAAIDEFCIPALYKKFYVKFSRENKAGDGGRGGERDGEKIKDETESEKN